MQATANPMPKNEQHVKLPCMQGHLVATDTEVLGQCFLEKGFIFWSCLEDLRLNFLREPIPLRSIRWARSIYQVPRDATCCIRSWHAGCWMSLFWPPIQSGGRPSSRTTTVNTCGHLLKKPPDTEGMCCVFPPPRYLIIDVWIS